MQIEYLLSPQSIREQAIKIMDLTIKNKTSFTYNPGKIQPTVEFVLNVMKNNYPDLNIPFHSRWVHFHAGGINRAQHFLKLLENSDPIEKARSQLDLVITSVLLDAGAGTEWSFLEETSGKSYNRSEGLGVASYHLFCSGILSSDKSIPKNLLRADSEGLKALSVSDLKKYFQVTDANPLIGIEGRVQLLNNLGKAMENQVIFKDGRPGNIIDYLIRNGECSISAPDILKAVLKGFGVIWPGRLFSGKVNLGDTWFYSKIHDQLMEKIEDEGEGKPASFLEDAKKEASFKSLVPIHKLSQWMTYSLIEPICAAGIEVTQIDQLTGLAEYRNGGLMIDSGILNLKNAEDLKKSWTPDSELIIEWRALTIVILDIIGEQVQKAIGRSSQEFPLAKVLEGGTWWAGRMMAKEKRAGGVPPLNIKSDGTVF